MKSYIENYTNAYASDDDDDDDAGDDDDEDEEDGDEELGTSARKFCCVSLFLLLRIISQTTVSFLVVGPDIEDEDDAAEDFEPDEDQEDEPIDGT